MSRTFNEKPLRYGVDYWKRRPFAGTPKYSNSTKVETHRIERRHAKEDLISACGEQPIFRWPRS